MLHSTCLGTLDTVVQTKLVQTRLLQTTPFGCSSCSLGHRSCSADLGGTLIKTSEGLRQNASCLKHGGRNKPGDSVPLTMEGDQAGMKLRGWMAQQLRELALESARWDLNLESLTY